MGSLLMRAPLFAVVLLAGAVAVTPTLAADADKGKAQFSQKCAICHANAAGMTGKNGPTLYGVVGRPAGSVPGYHYSAAMKAVGYAWSDDKLQTYLVAPQATVKGTKMTYGGVKNPAQLGDLIAYLDTLK
jgi:cytochrome c